MRTSNFNVAESHRFRNAVLAVFLNNTIGLCNIFAVIICYFSSPFREEGLSCQFDSYLSVRSVIWRTPICFILQTISVPNSFKYEECLLIKFCNI